MGFLSMKLNKKFLLTVLSVCIIGSSLMGADEKKDFADEERRPGEHRCPITLEVMRNPVVAADGHSYEREAISEYLRINAHAKSPSTGLPLKNKDLFDNHSLKAMINEWRPGRQSEPCELDTRSAEDIAQRVKEEFRRNAELLSPAKGAKGQHIVAFLGNTGAGKSTLVNLLAGKKLKVSEDGEDYVLEDCQDNSAMVIGLGGGSETLYPKSIDVDGLRFFDLPGFNDTDGSERNLVNAAFIRQILLEAASVRLVYVVGQDQFTADRSASVRHLFNSIKQLFVADQGVNIVDNGIFVATKITSPTEDIINFLLKKTDSKDKADLNQQLQSWSKNNRLCRMFHPIRGENINQDERGRMLSLIRDMRPAKILGINVSALYPSETQRSLERMFLNVMEGVFNRRVAERLTTLSDYDRSTALYTAGGFWQTFDAEVCAEENVISLLKEFCINPYNKALRSLERENESKRQAHIQRLEDKRQERVLDIEERTGNRVRHVISSLVPQQQRDDFVLFDFVYHKDYYDQVCGAGSIQQLATDPIEQEIVRQHYAGFISHHSHEQMMNWHQRFSGMKELKEELALMKTELRILKAGRVEEEEEEEEKHPGPDRVRGLVIPEIARGYEDIYRRFLKGALVYRPTPGSDAGKIELPIEKLANPLEGTFDLSRCGDTGNYLSIATGYRKGRNPQNKDKVEIWIAPRFMIEKELATSAGKFKDIMGKWTEKAPVGLFWTWGNWESGEASMDYLTDNSFDQLGEEDLLEKYTLEYGAQGASPLACPSCARDFHVSFCN